MSNAKKQKKHQSKRGSERQITTVMEANEMVKTMEKDNRRQKKCGIQGWNEALKIQLKRRIDGVDQNELFLENVLPTFMAEEKKADKNKKFHFGVELGILIFNAAVVTFNALMSATVFEGKYKEEFVVASTACSAIATALIAYRGVKQWRETWLRHRKAVNAFLAECQCYAYYIGEYPKYHEIDSKSEAGKVPLEVYEAAKLGHEWKMLKKFEENVVQILSNNNITFAENMNKNK